MKIKYAFIIALLFLISCTPYNSGSFRGYRTTRDISLSSPGRVRIDYTPLQEKKIFAIAVIVKDKPSKIVDEIKKELQRIEKKYAVRLEEVLIEK